jgi:heptosyltransferase-3
LFSAGGGDVPLAERPKTLVDGAHAVYTFTNDSPEPLRAQAPEAQVIALRTVPPDGWTRHASEWLLEQLKPYPTVRAAVEQMLRSVNARGVGTGRSHDGDVVVHPGSGSREKCWPVEKFVELIDRIRRQRLDVRVLLGEAELERFSKDNLATLEQHATAVRRPSNFLELFNELRSAMALVANDSGPAHLGAMVGVPTVALFGPTDPAVWKPLGPRVTALREEKLEKLSVTKVFAATKPLLGG